MTSYVQHDGDGDSVKNAEVAEAILNDNNELSHIEREVYNDFILINLADISLCMLSIYDGISNNDFADNCL